MKLAKTDRTTWALLLLLLALPGTARGQFNYFVDNGAITITGYAGPGGTVAIPNTINGLPVTGIWPYAFHGHFEITSVEIPASVTSIASGDNAAFMYCTNLTAITVDPLNPTYSSLEGVLFDKQRTRLIECPAGKHGSFTIPNSVTNMVFAAFLYCARLTNVVIGDGLLSIAPFAFQFCSSLNSITIGSNVRHIESGAFNSCTSLTNIIIGGRVETIGVGVFRGCPNLTSVTIGPSVSSLEDNAFDFLPRLKAVYFYGDAPSLGGLVFGGTDNATIYYLPGTVGWGPTFGDRPTALWHLPYPLILSNNASFGVQSNQFGFIISWATNIPVVVEASTNLSNPNWFPVGTNTLTGGSAHFSELQWANYLARFYRLRSP